MATSPLLNDEKPLTILVADDDALMRMVMEEHVRDLGHTPLVADNGAEAIELIRRNYVDLVLLDINMPEVDGFGVMQWMKDNLKGRWCPVIVISTLDEEAQVLKALESGADDYISKPVHHRIMAAKLRNFSARLSMQNANAKLLALTNEQRKQLQERIDREAWVANRIQSVLLLGQAVTQAGCYQVATRAEAANGANGDFMDVLPLDENTVDIVLGDVMGKGVLAALLGAEVKQQIARTLAEQVARSARALPEPAAVINAVHVALTPKLIELESFLTLVYLRLDRARGSVTVVTCGHLPALRLNARSSGHARRHDLLGEPQVPMGVLPDEVYEQTTHDFLPGDALVLCSDGLVEAQNTTGELYGMDRFVSLSESAYSFCATPGGLLEALRSELAGFSATPRLLDDLTMMVVMSPAESPTTIHTDLRLVLRRELGAMDAMRMRIAQHLSAQGFDELSVGRVVLVAVELFTNIVRHSQAGYASAMTELLLASQVDSVELVIEYAGAAFELFPSGPAPEPDLQREGGFGLHIVQALSLQASNRHAHGINQLCLTLPMTRTAAAATV